MASERRYTVDTLHQAITRLDAASVAAHMAENPALVRADDGYGNNALHVLASIPSQKEPYQTTISEERGGISRNYAVFYHPPNNTDKIRAVLNTIRPYLKSEDFEAKNLKGDTPSDICGSHQNGDMTKQLYLNHFVAGTILSHVTTEKGVADIIRGY